jgi:hypothetical protein
VLEEGGHGQPDLEEHGPVAGGQGPGARRQAAGEAGVGPAGDVQAVEHLDAAGQHAAADGEVDVVGAHRHLGRVLDEGAERRRRPAGVGAPVGVALLVTGRAGPGDQLGQPPGQVGVAPGDAPVALDHHLDRLPQREPLAGDPHDLGGLDGLLERT